MPTDRNAHMTMGRRLADVSTQDHCPNRPRASPDWEVGRHARWWLRRWTPPPPRATARGAAAGSAGSAGGMLPRTSEYRVAPLSFLWIDPEVHPRSLRV